ncbi:MAG: AAA family ATPase [Boseongicola sp. SB0677_bin_26]|nr:AAA family ATPase [Boseongicola sp. SB0665_bin_10]MYG26849.1 AAA family ATPase [Boseongicola sp. SB0677_bin_26]
MTTPKINWIEIQGFRAFGRRGQTLSFGSALAAVWAPNSQGKTSLAEAFEFLLTGQIVRRQLVASTRDEFADSLRNAHLPAEMCTFVEAVITGTDGKSHRIRRTLISDYAKRKDCQSALQIDGRDATQTDLATLGILLSQPPLAAPVLAQHTLGYLFSTGPQERATYFRRILEVTDLEVLRGAVAALEASCKPDDSDLQWTRLSSATAIETAEPILSPLNAGVPTPKGLAAVIDEAITAILTAADHPLPMAPVQRLAALEELLQERRAKTFPINGFERKPLADWNEPTKEEWDSLDSFLAERETVDEETRRLTALFREALAIPEVDAATRPIDCVLCGVEGSLTPERIAHIRSRAQETESFQAARTAAMDSLRNLVTSARALDAAAAAAPNFLSMYSKERRKAGFRIERIRALLDPSASVAIDIWLASVRSLARAWATTKTIAKALAAEIDDKLEDLDALDDPQTLNSKFSEAADAFGGLADAMKQYVKAEGALLEQITAVVDAASETVGWQELIDAARDQDALRASLVERKARVSLQGELKAALRQIDRGNELVLDDKFAHLSGGIQRWWDLLRPDEPTFFSAVRPRKQARRTVDFKAGLSLDADRIAPKVRDVVAVFSQSQLHCLGLALFIARALHERTGFIVLDDPILSSDEDYRANFQAAVLEELIGAGVQVIVLTQDRKTWKNLEHRYLHESIDMFQMELTNRADGTSVTNSGDDLTAMLTRGELLARGGHPNLRKQAGELLRDAAERFCKEMLVHDRWTKGDSRAALSDHDGKNLGQLQPKVEPLLIADPSHPGKLRVIASQLNPANHDDETPDQSTLKVALGDLKSLKKQYLP